MATDTPADPAEPSSDIPLTDLDTALGDAEKFLARTGISVHPWLSAPNLMRYLDQYRTHLCVVVASMRREQGLTIGHSTRGSED